jgi:alanine racemase
VVAADVTHRPDASGEPCPTVCRIDLDALRHNLVEVRGAAGAGIAVCGVVKSDAYGHGAVPIARALAGAGIDQLAVASFDEAAELRAAGVGAPVLVFGGVAPSRANDAADLGLTIAVWGADDVRAVATSLTPGRSLAVHLKLDTGMHRIGALPEHLGDLAQALHDGPFRIAGVMSHLACADEPGHASVAAQVDAFEDALRALARLGVAPPVRHLANSAGLLAEPRARFDMVRVGLLLYGCAPSSRLGASLDLRPVMHLRTHVAQLKTIPAGDRVGYGHTFIARRPTRIAVLPVGYASGYPRALSNRGEVLIRGRRAPVVGTVSMAHVTVDVTDVRGVTEGDAVTLWGSDGRARLDVMELGARAGTIGYELLTCVSQRTPRIYQGQ